MPIRVAMSMQQSGKDVKPLDGVPRHDRQTENEEDVEGKEAAHPGVWLKPVKSREF